jgi:O-antigen ligase
LYLNITEGYWGSETYVGGGEMAARLAGGPFDVINSNGLAFVILTVLPLLHFLTEGSFKNRLVYFTLFPAMMIALVKSLSRSGMLGFLIVYGFIFVRSKRKFLLLSVAAIALVLTIANMSDIQRDRYLSIVSSSSKQSGTAHGRIEGLEADFKVAMMRPVFGFGLGTSAEAKFHVLGHAQLAHNLYLEVAQELGLVGLAIYLVFLKRIIGNFTVVKKRLRDSAIKDAYILRLVSGLEVWMLMSLLFSLASYGLSDWSWYFFAGMSLALVRVAEQGIAPGTLPISPPDVPRRPSISSH